MPHRVFLLFSIIYLSFSSPCLAREYTMENTVLKDGIRYDSNNKPINGTVVVYYPSGELLLEMPYKDGKFHGVARGYMKEGPLYMELIYKSGKEIHRKTYYRSMVVGV